MNESARLSEEGMPNFYRDRLRALCGISWRNSRSRSSSRKAREEKLAKFAKKREKR